MWFQEFLSNSNTNYTYLRIIIIICLQIVIWFKLLSNINNLHTVIWFQVFLSNINSFQTDLDLAILTSLYSSYTKTIAWYTGKFTL